MGSGESWATKPARTKIMSRSPKILPIYMALFPFFFISFNMSVYALACVVDWAAKWSARSTGVRGPKLSIGIGFLLFLMIDFIFLTMYRWCDEWTGRYKDMLCKRKAKKHFDWKNNSFIMSISNTYNSLSIIIHLSYMILLLIVQWYIHKIVTK